MKSIEIHLINLSSLLFDYQLDFLCFKKDQIDSLNTEPTCYIVAEMCKSSLSLVNAHRL